MSDESVTIEGAVCPVPLRHHEKIVLGHGSGGKMTLDLIARAFVPSFNNPILAAGNDAGVVTPRPGQRLAISTDAHVVFPLFFPGGDIGKLAICGTVNDVAMMGAKPLYLTVSFILEEGLEMDTLERVIESMKASALEAGVEIVAGDTKVVQKGKADGLYISTAGVGILAEGVNIGGEQAKPGDVVILSGTVGDHGIAVLDARGELGFQSEIQSDVAPLNHMIEEIMAVSEYIHVLRDPTRGGVATTLNEIANQSQVNIVLYEDKIPVKPAVNSACEMLGFEPLYIANEGKLIIIAAPQDAQKILDTLHQNPYGKDAVVVGEVQKSAGNRVLMQTLLGSHRIVDILMGEMLPRIC